jgi:hypothetical protein
MPTIALLALIACALWPVTSAAQETIPIRVEVRADPSGLPLGYSVVSIPALGIERFTDAQGVVVLPVRPDSRVLLRVKRLGFIPRDTAVVIGAAAGQRITVALARVSFRLQAVQVVAWPRCRRPGIPARGGDSQLLGIVEQLRQNAERYRLLTSSYPFSYASEREFTQRKLNGPEEFQRRDTILVDGVPVWRYQPGRLISRDTTPPRHEWMMHIPVLSDLAEKQFIDNHCFHVAGLEEKDGQRLLRLDLVAAERLRGPDVNVSVWLDPDGYQLRHGEFTLSIIPRQFGSLLHVVSRVRYVEIVPGIPVMQETVAENLVSSGPNGRERTSYTERQRIVSLTYRGARPDQ